MNEYVPRSWQGQNVDAGTLKSFLVAFTLVVSISVGTTVGFQSWLDAGIRSHVDPVEAAVTQLRAEVEAYREETQALHTEVADLRRQIELTQNRQSRRDERILERLDEISEGTSQ